MAAVLLPLIVIPGLLVPGRSAQPEPNLASILARAATETVTSCQAQRRELHFGWIDADDAAQDSSTLHATAAQVCLAVYRTGAQR